MAGLSRIRTVVPLLLAAALLLPPVALAKEPRAATRLSPRETLAALWNAIPEAWTLFKSIWEREGSSLDPFGPPKPPEGSSLDPFGDP
jgi:hypothetical protein